MVSTTQARYVLLGMVKTGYRPSEGAALNADTIRLDAEVPHMSIEPDGRQLKSRYARRVIKLAGVSLEAFRTCPENFPRYRDSAVLSATVNKYLRSRSMLETQQHSFYSLGHAFEDRILAARIDDRIRRDLFGHRLDRRRYGRSASLSHLTELVRGHRLVIKELPGAVLNLGEVALPFSAQREFRLEPLEDRYESYVLRNESGDLDERRFEPLDRHRTCRAGGAPRET